MKVIKAQIGHFTSSFQSAEMHETRMQDINISEVAPTKTLAQ